jgi:oligopeptide transport system substrate-binding protein
VGVLNLIYTPIKKRGGIFMKKSLALVLTLVFLISVALTACTSNQTPVDNPEKPAEPKVLRLASNEPPNLDPQLGTDQVSIEIDNAILEGLIRVHAGEVQPGMAEKWEISEDGLTYTFHLRDAVWSDGKKVTAQDFEYSFIRLLDPATASEYAFQGYYILNGEEYNTGKITDPSQVGVKALDEKTFEVKLKVPTKYFLALTGFLSFQPSRKDLVEQYKEAYAADADKAVYNGPFVLTDWQHDALITLEKNDQYWNKDAIKLDSVEFTIVTDNKTVVNMYEAGDIDMAAIGKDFIDKYKAENKVIFYPEGSEWYFQFNVKGKSAETGKVLGNANFRKALAFAVDRQAFCDAIRKDGSTPAQRYILPLLAGNNDKFANEYPLEFYPKTADPAKAKEYLDKALAELNMTMDQVPAIEYLTDDNDTARTQAEAIQDMVSKNLGIKLEVKQVQFKQRLELMQASDYDIVIAGWGPDYDDPMTYMDLWVTGGGHNNTNWSSPKYDELIAFAKTSADVKARADAMFEAEKILLEEAAIIPFYFRNGAYAKQDYVKNVVRNFIGADPDFVFVDIEK